ncbi:CHAT domain-containing protein [cf. Phormidesmis sp. LEGE 11477]|uniref:CHAT domain-containing protein n=1 Tax=cf. Phormidesmis sp. LEGE 11477 TaxID=1828680 RepID=UPI00187E5077|nr:CHAT domain-containing protein [cf. Phormidesmis sp. LEGE 11477]MBE9063691.1 CHAT domain-containing protein [cf. Phormidesmis sp. LEGE 11477]
MTHPNPHSDPQPSPQPANNTFNFSNSTVTNAVGSGSIYYNSAATETSSSSSPEAASQTQVILFLAANPVATNPLRLDEEVREISEGLRRSKHRDRFEFKQQWAVRPRDLQRAMLDHTPSIVHFSGHGIGQPAHKIEQIPSAEPKRDIGFADISQPIISQSMVKQPRLEGLILETATGEAKLVPTAALCALFKLFDQSLSCVVLNACYSERQAQAIAQHIPYVIGMHQAISDRAAIEFAVGFYDALGAGESIERAYEIGVVAMMLADSPEHLTPVLIKS